MRQSKSIGIESSEPPRKGGDTAESKPLAGAQTLLRGLGIVEMVANGTGSLNDISAALGLSRSTAHRLAATLVEQRYLTFARRMGYALGPKLLELGFLARRHLSLPRIAREHLEDLASNSGDTVHLAIRDGHRALYLDKIPGGRRVEISSRVGELQPLRSTGIGKALILEENETAWRELYDIEDRAGFRYNVEFGVWVQRMRGYAARGCAFDLEENEDRIRCVAAPVRDASGAISGAISVSSAAQYMDDARMERMTEEVKRTADAISRDLGWNQDNPTT